MGRGPERWMALVATGALAIALLGGALLYYIWPWLCAKLGLR